MRSFGIEPSLTFMSACNQCFGWKKQLTRSRAAAKKAGKKAGSGTNLY